MKLIILGCGVAASHFLAGALFRFPPAYVIKCGDENLLLECSELVRMRLENIGIDYSTIKHCAISHTHPDHCALIHFVQSQLCKGIWGGERYINKELHIYCPNQLETFFDSAWRFYLPEHRPTERFKYPQLYFHSMGSSTQQYCDLGFCTLKASSVRHGYGNAEALAFRIETPDGILTYSGDCAFDERLWEFAANSSIFLCECSAKVGSEESAIRYGHLTPFQAGLIAKRALVKKLVLTHYTGLDSYKVIEENCRSSGYENELILAQDFMEIEI